MPDIERSEQTQETMALLKILELGNKQIQEGDVYPTSEVFARLREAGRAKVLRKERF